MRSNQSIQRFGTGARFVLALLLFGLLPSLANANGSTHLTKAEALELAFPKCELERGTVYLTKEQLKRGARLAGFDLEVGIVHPYIARRDGKLVGTAWFDVHRVRSKKEVLMIVVTPEHRIGRIEVLAFAEPDEYLPRASWYGQFPGRRLDKDLELGRAIKGITGATLSARATTRAARRVLALHEVVYPLPDPAPEHGAVSR